MLTLFESYDSSRFDEPAYAEREMKADARHYRDPSFRADVIATIEQRVADYGL